jgi:hypothetical protein
MTTSSFGTSAQCNSIPSVYAHLRHDEANRCIQVDFMGREIIHIRVSGNAVYNFRAGSDGIIQSSPMHQQTFLSCDDEELEAVVTFRLSEHAMALRPKRAGWNEAIIGTVNGRLPAGVNGLYDKAIDLFVDWHGQPWNYQQDFIQRDDESSTVSIAVKITASPWILNLRHLYYREHLGYKYFDPAKRLPNMKPIAGWCSWEAYRRDVTEEHVAEVTQFLADNFRDYGLEYVQLDDGFQPLPVRIAPDRTLTQSWLSKSTDFPSGLKALVDDVNDKGMSPGIWLSADVTEIEPDETGKTCQFLDSEGKPLKAFWMKAVLDCLPETLDKQIRPLYEGVRELGFDYVKIDQIRHLLLDALHEAVRQGLISKEDAEARFRNYMETAREALGDEIYCLASWGVLSEVIGCADACRISQDANPQWHAIRMQIMESARWFHAQRILFLCDPDHVCVRTNPVWARSLLSLVSLSGELFMLSDQVGDYDDDRVRMIQKCLPPLQTETGETGPIDMHAPAFTWVKQHGAEFQGELERGWHPVSDAEARAIAGYHETNEAEHPFGSLWAFHIKRNWGAWCTLARIATLPLGDSEIRMEKLSLHPDMEYLAFDFWDERFLGTVSGSISVPGLTVGACQVIALRPKLDRPQFVASTRHVSMGAVDVQNETWSDGVLTLDLNLVVGSTERAFIHLPGAYALKQVKLEGGQLISQTCEDGLVSLAILSETAEQHLKLQCSHTGG